MNHPPQNGSRPDGDLHPMTNRFEARELKTYAEPISADELKEGSVYFFVNFVDEEMLIPVMGTVIFIGENLEPGDANRVYFQDIDSFNRGVRYNDEGDGDYAQFQTGSKNELGHVFDYEHALDQLLACSLRRKSSGREESDIRPPNE